MTEVILQTKLHIPSLRPAHIQRKQLLDKLNDRLQTEDGRFSRKLTLVSAPAGFGKTTLVSSWLHQLDRPATWLSLDEADNEPGRFIYYMIAALQRTGYDLGDSALSLLQSPQSPPAQTLLTLLINDLSTLSGQVILVLDDYHVIQELGVHEAVTFLLNNRPAQLHLVIISREDPALPLHRLRGSGQMMGIHVKDLRFSTDEAALFLNDTMGLKLTAGEIAALGRRTEGWVAGLQLAALSMQDMLDTREFVTAFAGDDRYITDYLFAEVIERQPAHVQDFLQKTAIVNRFCASLCDALLGIADMEVESNTTVPSLQSQTIIEQLDRANLFIVALDNKREWYRYHHLFVDYLRLRLRDLPASQIDNLHRRAAAWYEDNGLLAEAIDHALAGQAFQQASHLIEDNALTTIFGHAGWATLFKWMQALPAEMIRARPRLSVQYAWALFTTGRWEAAASLLQDIRPALEAVPQTSETKRLLGELATIGALVAYSHGDMKRSTEEACRALSLLPEDNLTLRCVAHLSIGESAMIQEDVPTARQSLHESRDVALAAGNPTIALFALGDLSRLEMTAGYLHQAAEHCHQARSLGTVKGSMVLGPAGIACIQMGAVLYEWNELEKSESLLREGLELCQLLTGLPNIVLEGQVNLARVLLAGGYDWLAAETMAEAETLLANLIGQSSNPRPMISATLANRLRYWLAQGRLDTAARWLATNGIRVDSAISPGELTYHVILARILIEQGQLESARHQLRKVGEIRAERESPRLAVEYSILQALWLQALGKQDQAVAELIRALQLSEPEGFIRIFVDYGEPVTRLLEQAASQRSSPLKTKALLDIIMDGRPAASARKPDTAPLLEPLKDQELRILRLMAAGLSNREIAGELFLSVNTIKVYASRMYAKLGVRRRGEAVAVAQELNLL